MACDALDKSRDAGAASQPTLRGVTTVLSIPIDHPWISIGVLLFAFYFWMSIRVVGPTEVGLVLKRFALEI